MSLGGGTGGRCPRASSAVPYLIHRPYPRGRLSIDPARPGRAEASPGEQSALLHSDHHFTVHLQRGGQQVPDPG